MGHSHYLTEPKEAPKLNIPHSESAVDVRVIYTDTLIHLKPEMFWQPKLEGFDGPYAPIYCFLVSKGDRHVVFDLGVRKDWENLPPKIVSLVKASSTVIIGTDVASLLDAEGNELGVSRKDVESVIWSHNHFDHVGDPSTFPASTDLVVGPGTVAASWPGYPSNAEAGVMDSDKEGRKVREISFDGNLKIGRFDAHDFFGDGSFYLLDAPGHAIGHMCGLARVTTSPASFVFMGADACHHAGVIRPTEYLPLPRSISPSPFANMGSATAMCPGELLQQLKSGSNPGEPFFKVAESIVFHDHSAAMDTVRKIQELDASDNVFIMIAHDRSIRDRIPFFPKKINDWRANNLESDTRWLFCQEFEGALKCKLSKMNGN